MTNLLLIATQIKDVEKVNSFTNLWAYFLPPELEKLGCKITYAKYFSQKDKHEDVLAYYKSLDLSKFDCVLALGLRYFTNFPDELGSYLKAELKAKSPRAENALVSQIYDGSLLDGISVDINFTIRNDKGLYPADSPNNRYERHHKFNRYIGWASVPEMIKSNQKDGVLRVLVDHPSYSQNEYDHTLRILMMLKNFVESGVWKSKYSSVVVRQILDGKIADVDLNNIIVTPYKRKTIPFEEICAELSQANLFFITHTESVGQAAIEAATAGALVVVPEKCVPQDRLKTIRHYEFPRYIDWEKALAMIDIQASREAALQNSWEQVARNIMSVLTHAERPMPTAPQESLSQQI